MEPVPTATDAHAAAFSGEWPTVYEFYFRNQTSPVNNIGDTILHVLSRRHHSNIIRRLLQLPLLANDCLLSKNHNGNTALHEAITVGSMEIVEIMVETDERVLSICNFRGESPLYCAAAFGRKQILHFLYDRNNTYNLLRRFSANEHSTILHAAVEAKFYDLALDIVALDPSLALLAPNPESSRDFDTALNILVRSPASFRSGTGYTFKNIGSSPFILFQILQVIIYIIIPCQCRITITDWRDMDMMDIGCAIISGLRWIIRLCPLVRTVSDAKDMHSKAKRLAENLIFFQILLFGWTIEESFHLAIKSGVVEIVESVLIEFPDAVEWYGRDGSNILHSAAAHGSEQVFNFLKYKNIPINRMMGEVDGRGLTPLSLWRVSALSKNIPINQPVNVRGLYQKTSWEVFWFKSLKQMSLSHVQSRMKVDEDELFFSNKYVSDMSKTFMLISILIVMINFLACYFVPGGYNQNTGHPMFLGHPDLDGFLLHVSVALFCSFASIAAALSAHLSAFDIEDYYLSLPLKLYVGGTMLFMSVNCTLSAYVHAIRLKTQDSSYPHTGQGLYFVRHYGIVCIQVLTLLSYIEIMYPIFLGVLRVCLLEAGNMQYNLIRSIRMYWPGYITGE